MIVITGTAGFIGSCLLAEMRHHYDGEIISVDDFKILGKKGNWEYATHQVTRIERIDFVEWFRTHSSQVEYVFHLGARTDTTCMDPQILSELNLNYTRDLWRICSEEDIPFIYASSAATYGMGEFGFSDDHETPFKVKPLNLYAKSKNDFDKWALKSSFNPPVWAGLKFFNVFGPNEYHKGRMASVIWHTVQQIKLSGYMKLFKSHRPDFFDGHQKRDFIYVQDVIDIILYLYKNDFKSGLYNVGSGKARTFLDLTKATFKALGKEEQIQFIDMPTDLQDKYQYFTEADMRKLKRAGYKTAIRPLEATVEEYVQDYLIPNKYKI